MNKNQWYVLSIGLVVLSSFLFLLSPACSYAIAGGGDELTSCLTRRYAFGIPAIISFVLGILFMVLGWLERKH